jgi:hypothetical protein
VNSLDIVSRQIQKLDRRSQTLRRMSRGSVLSYPNRLKVLTD